MVKAKKRNLFLIVIGVLAIVFAGIFGGSVAKSCSRTIDPPTVCYYGCPNSKRVRRLSLKKRLEKA